MIKKITNTIKSMASKVKKQAKKIAIGLGIVGVAFAAEVALSPDQIPLALSIDGRETSVAYTDDNANEDLIIYSDARDYFNPAGNFNVIFSITNKSGKDQNVKIAFGFNDKSGTKKFIKDISEYDGEETIFEQVPKFTWGATGTDPTISMETKQRTQTKWKNHTLEGFARPLAIKDIGETKEIKASSLLLKDGETKFFKANIKYTDFKGKEKFFIEAFGNANNFGHLDPWTFTDLFNSDTKSVGDLNGQDSWSGGTAFDVVSATSTDYAYEGDQGIKFSIQDQNILNSTLSETSGTTFWAEKVIIKGSVGTYRTVFNDTSAVRVGLLGFRNIGDAVLRLYYNADAGAVNEAILTEGLWYVFKFQWEKDNGGAGVHQWKWWYATSTPNAVYIPGGGGNWLNDEANSNGTLGTIDFQANDSTWTGFLDTITPTDPTIPAAVAQEPDAYNLILFE